MATESPLMPLERFTLQPDKPVDRHTTMLLSRVAKVASKRSYADRRQAARPLPPDAPVFEPLDELPGMMENDDDE